MRTEERLENVERELVRTSRNRRLLAYMSLAVVVVSALAWIVAGTANPAGAAAGRTPTVVRANRFELVDMSGKVRATLEADGMETALTTFSRLGKRTAQLITSHDKVHFFFGEGANLSFVPVGVRPGGAPRLVLRGPKGKVVSLGVLSVDGRTPGPGSLQLHDSKEKVVWQAP